MAGMLMTHNPAPSFYMHTCMILWNGFWVTGILIRCSIFMPGASIASETAEFDLSGSAIRFTPDWCSHLL